MTGDWEGAAACRSRDYDPDWWFPAQEIPKDTARAVAVCRGCPVRVECLRFALDDHALTGVWAGTTSAERRQLRAHRTRVVS